MSKRVSWLTNKNGEWVKSLEITEELWKKSIEETLRRIGELLESAQKLLRNGGNEAVCAGLYIYAVEEYGKVLLLRQYSPSAGRVRIDFKDIFRDHRRKFEIATKTLPDACMSLGIGFFDKQIFDPNIFDTADVIADLEARKAVFYCDFADSEEAIKPIPPVDKVFLENAILNLRTIALGTDVNI